MYKILLVRDKRKNYADLYQYLTTTDNEGNIIPYSTEDIEKLAEKVEDMLNNQDYGKSDFLVIKTIDYNVISDILKNE